MERNVHIAMGVVALLCLGATAGCSKPAPITKPEYLAAANDMCKTSVEMEGDLVTTWVQDNPDDTGPDGTERFIRFTLIKHLHNTMNALRTIQAPAGDAAYLGSMYHDYDHALDIFYSDPLGTDSDDAEKAAEERFRSYGLKNCASLADDATKDISKKLSAANAEAKQKDAAGKAGATTTTVVATG